MVSWFQINLLKLVLEHAGCFRVGKLDDREPIFRVKLGTMGCFELGLPHYIHSVMSLCVKLVPQRQQKGFVSRQGISP